MVRVAFAPALQRHVPLAPSQVAPGPLGDVLRLAFAAEPAAGGYVLDDQGGLRKHVAVFVNGVCATDRTTLSDPVPDGAEVWVMQALSGG